MLREETSQFCSNFRLGLSVYFHQGKQFLSQTILLLAFFIDVFLTFVLQATYLPFPLKKELT